MDSSRNKHTHQHNEDGIIPIIFFFFHIKILCIYENEDS